jgi:hypothetical protein
MKKAPLRQTFFTEPPQRGHLPPAGCGVPFLQTPPWMLCPHRIVPHLVHCFNCPPHVQLAMFGHSFSREVRNYARSAIGEFLRLRALPNQTGRTTLCRRRAPGEEG